MQAEKLLSKFEKFAKNMSIEDALGIAVGCTGIYITNTSEFRVGTIQDGMQDMPFLDDESGEWMQPIYSTNMDAPGKDELRAKWYERETSREEELSAAAADEKSFIENIVCLDQIQHALFELEQREVASIVR